MRDLYLPIPLVEALGRTVVARSQLELSLNIILAILVHEPDRFCPRHPRDALEVKLDYLATVPRSRLLKSEWWRALRKGAAHGQKVNERFAQAAMGTIYSRGGGYLEEVMRPMAQQLNLGPPPLGMTPGKIDEIADAFRALALELAQLAASLLKAARTLSILPPAA